ncbi:hypothetical protein ACQJBY_048945 [Aegilops geniculata]
MCSAVVRKREVRRCRDTPSPPLSSGHIPGGPPAVERQLVPVLTSCRSATQEGARAEGEESSTLPGSLPLLPPPPPAEEVGRCRQMGCSPLGSPSGSIAQALQCGSS